MRSETQEKVCERENSVEMNEFKSWKLAEICLEMRALKVRKLEIFSLLNKPEFSQYFTKSKDFSMFNPLQMNYMYK